METCRFQHLIGSNAGLKTPADYVELKVSIPARDLEVLQPEAVKSVIFKLKVSIPARDLEVLQP